VDQFLRVRASVASERAIRPKELVHNRHLSALLIEVGHQLTVRAWRLAGPLVLDVVILHWRLVEVTVPGTIPVVPIVEHLS